MWRIQLKTSRCKGAHWFVRSWLQGDLQYMELIWIFQYHEIDWNCKRIIEWMAKERRNTIRFDQGQLNIPLYRSIYLEICHRSDITLSKLWVHYSSVTGFQTVISLSSPFVWANGFMTSGNITPKGSLVCSWYSVVRESWQFLTVLPSAIALGFSQPSNRLGIALWRRMAHGALPRPFSTSSETPSRHRKCFFFLTESKGQGRTVE